MMRSAGRTLLLCCALCACLGACAGAPPQPFAYKLYPGPVRPASELAVVRFGDAQYVAFDGRPTSHADWTEVHLLPGTHRIDWQSEFGVSVMVEPSGWVTGGESVDAELAAGRTYVLRADRTTGYGYRLYFWIEDEATGGVVAGERKP
jgi:hypothetical protein